MARQRRDISGQKFGRLTVIGDVDGGKNPTVQCRCECGRFITVCKHNLVRGNTRSCGCLRSETAGRYRRKRAAPRKYAKPDQEPMIPVPIDDDEFWEDW